MYKYFIWDPNNSQYQIWELKHVESIRFGLSKTSQPYGIPTKSSSATQIFENQGPVGQFSLDFVRFDYEEEVPNWDFMYARDYKSGGKRYQGIDWYTSRLQTTRPYRLAIIWEGDNIDGQTDPGIYPTGVWNISINNITYSTESTNPGMGKFSITFTERRK
jgi:hypothetical protein